MFEALGDKLHDVFRRLRGNAVLSEENISAAMQEITDALLEADVNVSVAQTFIDRVRSRIIGENVLKSVTPAQQVVKLVHDELVALLGGDDAPLNLSSSPTVILLAGLHGSGKTTTAAKLANYLRTYEKKHPLLVACDIYRPAAVEQLETLGRELEIPVFTDRGNLNVPSIAYKSVEYAKFNQLDVVILDTAGRLQIDESMIAELISLRNSVRADEVLLVADAALGQEAVAVAKAFHKAIELTGFILTKLDGDARGGAALSIREVTGQPIKFVGVGEKLNELDFFHPDRMASRILGMGDVVSLVEKAARDIDTAESEKLKNKLRKSQFDFNDFLSQLRQLSRLGGVEGLLRFLPGGRQMREAIGSLDEKYIARMEAMVLSMTPSEREEPERIDFSRRKRIARGSGTRVEDVSGLIKQFIQMRKMMKKTGLFSRLMSGNAEVSPGSLPAGAGGGAAAPLNAITPVQTVSRKEQEKKKRLAKLQKKERQKQRRKKR